MEEIRKLILAVSLSIIVLGAWHYFVEAPKIEKHRQMLAAEKKKQPPVPVEAIEEKKGEKVEIVSREKALAKNQRIPLKSSTLHGSISLKGARLDDITLAGHRQTVEPNSPDVELLSPSGAANVYFAEFGWLAKSRNVTVPGKNSEWQAMSSSFEAGKPFTLFWQSPEGVRYTITFTLDDHNMFAVRQSIENFGNDTVKVLPYGLLNRAREPEQEVFISHEGVVGAFDEILQEVTYSEMQDEKKLSFENVTGWFGFGDKYWLTAIIPEKDNSFDAHFNYSLKNRQHRFQVDYIGHEIALSPGEKAESSAHLYAGAKRVHLLDSYAEELQIPLFDRAVDFGWLYFMTKPIFTALKFFYGFFGNFGMAILCLTVIIKLILFPLANKSYKSMNQMKRVQPELLELRERYKDDKMRLNQEVMEFYKREKINPMSGCLPLLVQIPVFFALYKVLFVTIEMRHAPFYGWIRDLSAPDPTSIFTLFGLLPFDLPMFLTIGAWPVIMCITMIIQQKLNPTPPDPIQAKVMKMLPFIFVFIFAQFPAGLVIYWAWNNALSIIQQKVIAGGIEKGNGKGKKARA